MDATAPHDSSIGEGGPLRRFEAVCHLTTLRGQLAAVLLFTWVPIVVFSLLHERVTGGTAVLLHHPAVHVRLLVGAPVLLLLDHIFPSACNHVLRQLSRQGFITEAARPRWERLLRSAKRLSDSALPEIVLAVACVALGVAVLSGVIPVAGLIARDSLTAAQIWYGLTALPLFEFLLLRSLWRWIIWLRVLIGLARIDLDLDPTNPDGHGGIGFLRAPSLNYCLCLLFTIASVLCAEWGARGATDATLTTFLPPLLAFAILGTLLAYGPLLLFIPQLVRARREARDELGRISAEAGRWLRRTQFDLPDTAAVIQRPEVQGLAALSAIYREASSSIGLFMLKKRDLVLVVLVTLLPMVPLMVWKIPYEDWVSMARMVTRALP
ncbi:MAG: hypothetical protein KF773_04985 [Deltaproteobacteria bacterium]|nr:hypothetical protein [Deltaproteobacteria bacterium]MCW5802131.1 hypothetical protein [Deltaproteobacteria bacterium]